MEKNWTSDPTLLALNKRLCTLEIPKKYQTLICHFFEGYAKALTESGQALEPLAPLFFQYLDLIHKQCLDPFLFQPYHHRIRSPFDYYQFGIDFLKPLIDLSLSSVRGEDHLEHLIPTLALGHNAIFLANHQTEADPQAISILLEKIAPEFAEKLIFVAGERVITDPLAVPFSMGRNLLCIYSKRYIDVPPELKRQKQMHNKKTMELMSELLSEGGKAIYIAPSGGRDRPNAEGCFEVAPFDPQSIEMVYLMAGRSGSPTAFYPMALKTHELLPPPETIQQELGETRYAKRSTLHLAFGTPIDMEQFPGHHLTDKRARREARAQAVHALVNALYTQRE